MHSLIQTLAFSSLVALSACGGVAETPGGETGPTGSVTSTSPTTGTTGATGTTGTTGTSTTGTTGTGTGTSTTGTTGTSTTTPTTTDVTATTPSGVFGGVATRLHEYIESIVYVSWEQAQPGTVHLEYSFDVGEWHQTPSKEWGEGVHEEMLLGVPFSTTVTFRVVYEDSAGDVVTADMEALTGPTPTGLPDVELTGAESDFWVESDRYLLGSINQNTGGWTGGTYWKWIIDRQGRYVWAMKTPSNHWTIYVRESLDGNYIMWDEQTYWSDWDGGRGSEVHKMTIDGEIVQTYPVPGEHHVWVELPDGSIVWGAADDPSETLERLNPDGTVDQIWDCDDFHDSIGVGNDCQSNTLFWHESTDTFLYSFYTTSTAVEIDHATGATLRQWGQLRESWDFDPPDSMFSWQHGLVYTDEGTLLLSTEVELDDWDFETAAREYIVDDDTETLVEIWNFGLGRGLYANTAGETHRLENGNTLHNYGSAGKLMEVTHDKDIVWGLDWNGTRLIGRTVYVDDLYDFAP